MHGRPADEPGGTLTRRQEALELGVFLLLIVPSLALSFVAVRQGMLPFPLVAASTILRDVGLVALVLLFLARAGQSVAAIGWTPRTLGREIVLGVVLSPVLLIGAQALETLLRSVGLSTPRTPTPGLVPARTVGDLLLALLLVAVVAVAEETIFRGYLILRSRRVLRSRVWAVVLSTVVFALGHGYEGSAGVVTVGATGLVFALIYLWRQSLVAPVVMHFLLDLCAIVLLPVLLR